MQTRQLMEIIYVLCTLYYALQPMLLEVLCLSYVSEMPRLKSYQGSTDQACTIWQRGLLYFVVPWRAYSHRVVQIQESARCISVTVT